MKLSIKSIRNGGKIDDERIVIDVLEDADLGNFALLRTHTNAGDAECRHHHAYDTGDDPSRSLCILKGNFRTPRQAIRRFKS
jgi:hypothetical protein